MKGGLVYYYTFKLDNETYKGDMRSGRLKKIGDKCFVIFEVNNYKNNKMLLKLPLVHDSIKNIPKGGWVKLPIENIEKTDILDAMN